jgi:hypothetical protein
VASQESSNVWFRDSLSGQLCQNALLNLKLVLSCVCSMELFETLSSVLVCSTWRRWWIASLSITKTSYDSLFPLTSEQQPNPVFRAHLALKIFAADTRCCSSLDESSICYCKC